MQRKIISAKWDRSRLGLLKTAVHPALILMLFFTPVSLDLHSCGECDMTFIN